MCAKYGTMHKTKKTTTASDVNNWMTMMTLEMVKSKTVYLMIFFAFFLLLRREPPRLNLACSCRCLCCIWKTSSVHEFQSLISFVLFRSDSVFISFCIQQSNFHFIFKIYKCTHKIRNAKIKWKFLILSNRFSSFFSFLLCKRTNDQN